MIPEMMTAADVTGVPGFDPVTPDRVKAFGTVSCVVTLKVAERVPTRTRAETV